MTGETVLVTGGAGYVGSHTCKHLAARGYRPVVYDDLSRGHAEFVKWGPLERGDVRDLDNLLRVMRAHRPAVVLHFAALAYVAESFEQPQHYYGINVGGTATVLDAMRLADCRHIVFSSSCAIYGVPQKPLILESDPAAPISPYGTSKYFAERVIAESATAHDVRWIALRYFNATGADADLEIGEWHEPEPHVLPRLIGAAVGPANRRAFEVFGGDHQTLDGSPVRDYVHVADLASAHVAAVSRLLAGGASGPINLGNSRGVSVFELIRAVEEVTQHRIEVVVSPRRPGDPPSAVADAGLAGVHLGWQPRYCDMREIIESAVRWHRQVPGTLINI